MNPRRLARLGLGLAVAVLALLALASAAARLGLYYLDDLRPALSRHLAERLGAELTVRAARSEWAGPYPGVVLEEVELRLPGAGRAQRFERVELELDFVATVLRLAPRLVRVTVAGGQVELVRRADGGWGLGEDPAAGPDGLELPAATLRFRDVALALRDAAGGGRLDLGRVDLDLESGLTGLELRARNRPAAPDGAAFRARAAFGAFGGREAELALRAPAFTRWRSWLPAALGGPLAALPEDAAPRFEGAVSWTADALRSAAGTIVLERPPQAADGWRRLELRAGFRSDGADYGLALGGLSVDGAGIAGPGRFRLAGERLAGRLERLDLGAAQRLLRAAGIDPLPDTELAGELRAARGSFDPAAPERYRLRAEGSGLELRRPGAGLQLAGVDAELAASGRGFRLRVDSRGPRLRHPLWGERELSPDALRGTAELWPDGEGWALRLSGVAAESPRLSLRGGAWLAGGVLHVDARIDRADLAGLADYLPQGVLPPADDRWARAAFRAGELRGARLELHGPAADLLAGPAAALRLRGRLAGLELDYEPGLPPMREVDGTLLLDGRRLHALLDAAALTGFRMRHGAVLIGDLGRIDLHGSGRLDGPVADLTAYLEQLDALGPGFRQAVAADGEAALDLVLNLPLDDRLERPERARGFLDVRAGEIEVPGNGTRLTDVAGRLSFADGRLDGRLEARFQDRPARLRVSPTPAGDTAVAMELRASPADFLPPKLRGSFGWLEGHSRWRIDLLLPDPAGAGGRRGVAARARSDLEGVAIDLPAPLGKPAAAAAPLELEAQLELDGRVDLTLAQGRTRARLAVDAAGRARGAIAFGAERPPPPRSGALALTGRLSEANLDEWLDWRRRRAGGIEVWPEVDALRVDRLRWREAALEDLTVSARREGEALRVEFDAPLAAGRALLPDDARQPVEAHFRRLHLGSAVAAAEKAAVAAALDPGTLPPLRLSADELQLGAYRLQRVAAETAPGPGRMEIVRLAAAAAEFSAALTGRWTYDGAAHRTEFEGAARSGDLGATLDFWSVGHTLREGALDVDVAAHWPGTPLDYELRALGGAAELEGRDGRIRHVAPEAARVLALLNLEMIFKRLSLDFDDVLRGGFSYDRAEGRLEFRDGSLYTEGVRVVGPSAQFLIVGRIGVAAEDYDLLVVATPETSALLPVAIGAPLGAVGIGAVYAVNKALELFGGGFDEVTTTQYRVTGSWSEPVIDDAGAADG